MLKLTPVNVIRIKRIIFLMVVVTFFMLETAPSFAGKFEDGQAAYRHKDYKLAYKLWLPLAQEGNAAAQCNIGILSHDWRTKFKWYKKSAQQGNAWCQFNLGSLYYHDYPVGPEVPKSLKLAKKWWRRAAQRGDLEAQMEMAGFYIDGPVNARKDRDVIYWYKKAAAQGYSLAQIELGRIYGNEINKNYVEASKWFKLAADQGDQAGQYDLGRLYEAGNGVRRDYKKAAAFYRLAGMRGGDLRARWRLGLLYARGLGVPQSYERAYYWMDRDIELAGSAVSEDMDEYDLLRVKSHLTTEQIRKIDSQLADWPPEKGYVPAITPKQFPSNSQLVGP